MKSNDFAFTNEDGKYLVKLARETLTTFLAKNKKIEIPLDVPKKLMENSGVFVTLHVFSKKKKMDLRGCIGRPYPGQSLLRATIDSAIDSGINDWRFPKLKYQNLNEIIFEVTALTPPVKIEAESPQERLEKIEIGRDGLIIEMKGAPKGQGGLFLPQVPVEWKMNKETYLKELCGKAGISSDMWKEIEKTNLYKFQGEIFSETFPNGDIIRKIL
ncbi:MAG: TIGR00296 family protein, partial [archaeon]|nr:TIGR00296 family protein [archaeon]